MLICNFRSPSYSRTIICEPGLLCAVHICSLLAKSQEQYPRQRPFDSGPNHGSSEFGSIFFSHISMAGGPDWRYTVQVIQGPSIIGLYIICQWTYAASTQWPSCHIEGDCFELSEIKGMLILGGNYQIRVFPDGEFGILERTKCTCIKRVLCSFGSTCTLRCTHFTNDTVLYILVDPTKALKL